MSVRSVLRHAVVITFLGGMLVTGSAFGRGSVPARAAETSPPSPAPSPMPSVTATPDAEAQRIFARARDVWRARTDVPYVRYGALVRYLHDGHVFDNWWDVYYRASDGALAMMQLHDIPEEKRRLGGVPFSIFGFKIFDTNPDAEPIRVGEPRIDPASSFGILSRFGKPYVARPDPTPKPGNAGDVTFPDFSVRPQPDPSSALREISRVEADTRDYEIHLVGTETIAGAPALHLTLVALRDPKLNRIRDVWVDPVTYRTVQMRVQGVLNGKPYDGIEWTIHYTLVDGREYVQQVVADEPLAFGLDTSVPKFEFDFVDFHFPPDVPKFTFDRPF